MKRSPGVKFSSFEEFQLNNSGDLAFVATLQGPGVTDANDRGIWLRSDGETSLVIRNGQSLEVEGSGYNTVDFAFLEQLGLGDDRVLFSTRFTDQRTGIFEWTRPLAAHAASADFDGDCDIDGGDLLDLLLGFGTVGTAAVADGDANWDGSVDRDDFEIWRTQVQNTTSTIGAANVPEPSSVAMLALMCSVLFVCRRRWRTK